jgi:hypothetical protein
MLLKTKHLSGLSGKKARGRKMRILNLELQENETIYYKKKRVEDAHSKSDGG